MSLADYRGRRVVVYFYPAASTPGCTKEACDFRDNLSELNGAGLDVLGISPDKPAKLAKFRDKEGLTFPLLSDADKGVLTAWGAYGEKQMYGKTVTGVIRSTFVIDPDGKVGWRSTTCAPPGTWRSCARTWPSEPRRRPYPGGVAGVVQLAGDTIFRWSTVRVRIPPPVRRLARPRPRRLRAGVGSPRVTICSSGRPAAAGSAPATAASPEVSVRRTTAPACSRTVSRATFGCP